MIMIENKIMKRVEISFNGQCRGNGKEHRRSSHQLCAFPKGFDRIYQQLHIPPPLQSKILLLKSSHSHQRQSFSSSHQVLTQNSRVQHRTITDHLAHSCTHTQRHTQKHAQNKQGRDRTQVIHSRTNPRCHLLRKNSSSNDENRGKQPQNRSQRHSFGCLINPEELLEVAQVKKMSLNFKAERESRLEMQASPIVKKKAEQAKKWWGVTDRPWSPRRHNLDFQTINQFLSNY